MKLTNEQIAFLNTEFGMNEIDYNNLALLEEIRLKCFDIEVEETHDRLERGIDEDSIGERGDMAVTIIDTLYDILSGNNSNESDTQ